MKRSIAGAIIVVALGVWVINLPDWQCNKPLQPSGLEKALHALDSSYRAQERHYNHQRDSLTLVISRQDSAVATTKEKTVTIVKRIREVVHDTATAQPVKELLTDCGHELQVKDSLLAVQKRAYESLVKVQDSAKAACDTALKKQSDIYQENIMAMEKQVKKDKRKAWRRGFVTGAAIGLTGGLLVP